MGEKPTPLESLIEELTTEFCAAKLTKWNRRFRDAHIAQSVEHFLGKEEVIGSNPIVSTIYDGVRCSAAGQFIRRVR